MRLPGCTYEVTPTGCLTRFDDGTEVPAEPHDTYDYRERAALLGYGADTLAMCRDRERLHGQLAEMLGLPHSPALWSVAHPSLPKNDSLIAWEEAAVLAIQRFLTAARAYA